MEITQKPAAILTPETMAKINKHLAEIEKLLNPVVEELDTKRRKELAAMRDKTQAFVTKSVSYAKQLPIVLPRTLEAEGMEQWLQLAMNMEYLAQPTQRLLSAINDTRIWSSANAYDQSRRFYRSLKDNLDSGIVGVDTAYADLSKRFKGGNFKNTSTENGMDSTVANGTTSESTVEQPFQGSPTVGLIPIQEN